MSQYLERKNNIKMAYKNKEDNAMKNVEYLEKLLKKNSKVRMLILHAVNNNMSEVIKNLNDSEYITELISAAVQKNHIELTAHDTECVAGWMVSAIETYNHSNNAAGNRLNLFEAAMKGTLPEEAVSILESCVTDLEISGIDSITTHDADCVASWVLVRKVLDEIPMCRETLVSASSFKRNPKKREDEFSTQESGSDKINNFIRNLPKNKTKFEDLTEWERKVIGETLKIAIAEAEDARAAGKTEVTEQAESLIKETKETVGMLKNYENFVQKYINDLDSEEKPDKNLCVANVIYQATMVQLQDLLNCSSSMDPEEILFNELKLPGMNSLLMATNAKSLRAEDAIREYAHREIMIKELLQEHTPVTTVAVIGGQSKTPEPETKTCKSETASVTNTTPQSPKVTTAEVKSVSTASSTVSVSGKKPSAFSALKTVMKECRKTVPSRVVIDIALGRI